MNGRAGGSTEGDSCAKRVWVMTVLSDDEAIGPEGALPQGLEFHLSRCASCRALADELRAVTSGLGVCGSVEVPGGLQAQADSQAQRALAAGATQTGRTPVVADEAGRLDLSGARWRGWVMPLAAAAVIALAVGVVGVVRLSGGADPNRGANVVEVTKEPVKPEGPEAALVRDPVDSSKDPTAVPEAYRSEACEGENCVERAFVPGRGRHRSAPSKLDTTKGTESNPPAPDDR